MTVSVIIPSYNHAKYLEQRIESVLNQTHKDFEIILLDDASTDESRSIILEYQNRYPSIITCFNEKNSGIPAIQWNKGVSMSKGEFIWIAESDDFADPEFLSCLLKEITKSDKIGLVYCNTWFVDEKRRIKYKYSEKENILKSQKLNLFSFVRNPIPNVSSVLFRKCAYLEIGGADVSFRFCSDWFFYLKLIKLYEIIYVPDLLNSFRLHENSSFTKHYSSNRFLKEKFILYMNLLHEKNISSKIITKIVVSLFISLVLRIINYLKFPSFLMPDRPQIPKQIEIY